MKLIDPVTITDALLVSGAVPETDYAAWNAATNYTVGQRVIRTTTHRIYENLIAGINASTPESAPTRWNDVAPTNRWAMFDDKVGTVTAAGANTMSWSVSPGAVDTLALLDVSASSARAVMTVGGIPVYDQTISLENADTVGDWWDYLWSPIVRNTTALFTDLPPYRDGVITVTLTDGSPVSCGTCIVGQTFTVGDSQFGARAGITDFSRKSTDGFGVTTVVQRSYAKRTSQAIVVQNTAFDEVMRKLSALRSRPVLYIGASGLYDAFVVYGFFKSFELELAYESESLCSLDIEGLT